tara:strand:- start:1199 stop:1333 length:135 start_codon:yes stop_codon:yes gene_type:complete
MLGLGKIAKKVFGTPNDRRIREVQAIVENIMHLKKISAFSPTVK